MSRPKLPITHGTTNGYNTNKCRCDECRAYAVEHNRRWRANNPEKKLEWDRQWRAVNRDKARESGRRWREANPGKATEQVRAWSVANPERAQELNRTRDQRYRARRVAAFVEDVPPREIFVRDNWHCMIPGCLHPGVPVSRDVSRTHPLYASVDHVVPLTRGGLHERSNMACAHLQCNRVKGNRAGIAKSLSENGAQL